MSSAAGLSIRGLTKSFGRFQALDDISLEVAPGEFLALLGPSGSGKTTLLRAIAGLSSPDTGEIVVDGRDFLAMSARERRVGMVFQHYALFRHMTVAGNVGFGLRVRPRADRPPKADVQARVEELLELVQLAGLGRRFPAQLSGGQRQRVALARALAIEPRLLLLDEPFGALDAKVRKDLRAWLREIHDLTGVTTIFVTHDQEEAMQLADRVAVLKQGRIEQIARPAELEESPASAFVFEFLGDSNSLPCQALADRAHFDGFHVPAINPGALVGDAIARFRPHDTEVSPDGHGWAATVSAISHRGAVIRVECRDESNQRLEAEYPRGTSPDGLRIGLPVKIRPRRAFLFDR